MPATVECRNRMLDTEHGTGAASGTYLSLHDGDPGVSVATALSTEIAGARQQANLAAASNGAKALAAPAVFQIAAGEAPSHYGVWQVASGGTQAQFKGSEPLVAAEGAYGSAGTYSLNSISLTAAAA